MKFCPVVPEICRGQVHGPRKERRKRKRRIIIIKNNNKKQSKNNKSPKLFGRLNKWQTPNSTGAIRVNVNMKSLKTTISKTCVTVS
jgi:hypothetical protein